MEKDFDRMAIRRLRKDRGLSLAEFGKPLGMRGNQVSMLETHVGYPNLKTIIRIMNAYCVPESYFFKIKSISNSNSVSAAA